MATNVGGVEVDLAANIAAFRADMGKANAILASNAQQMNRSLSSIDRGMNAVNSTITDGAARIARMGLRLGAAALGFTSLRSVAGTLIASFRDLQGEADKVGLAIDSRVSDAAAVAVLRLDRLKVSAKAALADFAFEDLTEKQDRLAKLRLQMAMEGNKQSGNLGELDTATQIELLESEIKALEKDTAALSQNERARAELAATMKRLEGDESWTQNGRWVGRNPGGATPFDPDNMLDPSERIDKDPVHATFAAADDAMFERMRKFVAEQDQALEQSKRAWGDWRDGLSRDITDALLSVDSFGDGMRAIGVQMLRSGISKFAVSPILDMIGSGLGIAGARAGGGSVSGGSSYLVGEDGPEIFSPTGSGTIIPNRALRGGAGTTIINADFRGAAPQAVARIERGLALLAANVPSIAVNAVARSRARSGRR